jgi:hypothetical protein
MSARVAAQLSPPTRAGSWQGGTYGCETNENPCCWGILYTNTWHISAKFGYGDGTSTYYFTDNLHNIAGHQDGVLVPQVPEPGMLGLLAASSLLVLRRRAC